MCLLWAALRCPALLCREKRSRFRQATHVYGCRKRDVRVKETRKSTKEGEMGMCLTDSTVYSSSSSSSSSST